MMAWSPDETFSDNSCLFNERAWETGYLDELNGLNERPFSYSQYSFHAANPSMLHSTQGHEAGAINVNCTSQYSVAQGDAVTSQFMGYNTPMPGQPTPISAQPILIPCKAHHNAFPIVTPGSETRDLESVLCLIRPSKFR